MFGMYWLIGGFVAGLVLFNFLLWKILREEYETSLIFQISFWLSLVAILGLWWPVAQAAGFTLVILVYAWRKQLDFWQWWDIVLPCGLLAFAPIFRPWWAIASAAVLAVGLWMIHGNYRRFSWYKSGRFGFTASFALLAWMSIQIEVAKQALLWVYLGLAISVVSAVIIYVRSGRNLWPQTKRNRLNQ